MMPCIGSLSSPALLLREARSALRTYSEFAVNSNAMSNAFNDDETGLSVTAPSEGFSSGDDPGPSLHAASTLCVAPVSP
jgi:hypothetical protein